jgi:hypothetical protein
VWYVQRSRDQAMGRRRGRTGWRHVMWPLAIGLVFCALGLWSGLVYRHNQAAFRAQAVPAEAVIDQIYAGPLSLTINGARATFDQYGLVRFEVRGRTAHARVLLVAGCSGPCFPVYHVGQVLTVYYSPANLSYAQLRSSDKTSTDFFYAIFFFGFFGITFLVAAVINTVAAIRDA